MIIVPDRMKRCSVSRFEARSNWRLSYPSGGVAAWLRFASCKTSTSPPSGHTVRQMTFTRPMRSATRDFKLTALKHVAETDGIVALAKAAYRHSGRHGGRTGKPAVALSVVEPHGRIWHCQRMSEILRSADRSADIHAARNAARPDA